MHVESKSTDLRLVALFEAGKGILVFATAFAAFEFIHSNVEAAAEQLVRHFHLNPASHYPRIFLDAVSNLNDTRLMMLGIGAMAYATVRFAEAYGLWYGKRWAWMLGMASAGIYVPVEIFNLIEHVSWAGMTVFLVNCFILALLWRGRPV
jgi:uncharacterized membrane protein (DUF2068 family)